MGTDPSGAGPEDEPRGSCLSNLFWLSHVFKTNPVTQCIQDWDGDKSSFVTNTIPRSPNGKASTRERGSGHSIRSVRVFLLNVRRQHRRGTRTSRKVFLSLTMMFHDDLSPMKISQLIQPEKIILVRNILYSTFEILFFPYLLNSRAKFIPY